MFQTIEQ